MSDQAEHRVVVSGVGTSAIGRLLGRSPMQLTLDAVREALADAGLALADIDGLATLPGPIAEPLPGFLGPDLYDVQDALGLELGWHLSTPQGAGQIAPLQAAVLAVSAGLCRHALVFRAWTESSSRIEAKRAGTSTGLSQAQGPFAWLLPTGAVSIANYAALHAHRHMFEYGTTREQLGWVAITERAAARLNSDAVLQEPLDMDAYLSARLISTPLGLLDCDLPVDGAVAVVVSSVDTASDLRSPVRVEAMGAALGRRPLWEQWPDLTTMAAFDAANQLWGRTELRPADVDVAQLYDGFSIFVLLWLEAFGFCGRGESGAFVEGGSRIALDGALPLNTWGGQLSAGRMHGYGFLIEAVRQLRGEAGGRQLARCEVAAVGVGGGPIAGALLLTK